MAISGPSSLRSVLRKLQRLVRPSETLGLTDAELLDRFARSRDEAAFAEILQRHGRMVLGVCLRILGDWHAAEDAYQATFLVLARRAGAGGWQASVGNWLHGVACRVARKERLRLARRQSQPLPELPEPMPRPDDMAGLLDEELSRLPEKYRAPLVLCYLEGRSNEEAARRLGWPIGTVWCHLSRGRQILRSRLERRGVALGAAALAALVGRDVAAAATDALAERTTQAALAFAIGRPLEAAMISANALQLARAGSAVMTVHRWVVVAASVLMLAWVAAQVGGTGSSLQPAPSSSAELPAPKRPMPAPPPMLDPSADPAIRAGLVWLVKEQQADGRWIMNAAGGVNNDVGATGIALLAFLSVDAARDGSPAARKYGPSVSKGIQYLLKAQKEDGTFDRQMYAHGIATLALCQAQAQSGDARQKKAAEKALALIVKAQAKNGAWGYTPDAPPRGDSSIAGWQCLALEAGERIGIPVPADTWKRYAAYLDEVAHESGAYGYASKHQGSIAVTAECLLGRLRTGWEPRRLEFIHSVEYIDRAALDAIASDAYAGYSISLLMTRQGADSGWMQRYRAEALKMQQADGSWPAAKSAPYPAMMTTALTLASLQNRTEFVPLPKPPGELTDAAFDALWDDLAAASTPRATQAMRTLAALSARTVAHAKKNFVAVKPADAKRVAALLAELDNDTFAARERAEKELGTFGEGARGDLERALKQSGRSLEYRRRVERLLEAVSEREPSAARLKQTRVLRVLEYIGTPEAREVLLDLATGAPGATLTREARAALDRLDARTSR